MINLEFIKTLGFQPRENTLNIYTKRYSSNYFIDIDLKKECIFYGGKIKVYDKYHQNITKPEDWIVLECVNRLLEKGYKPENILLEKVYPAGHGFSGRLDICVTRDDGSAYMMIECKTHGAEFKKEFKNIEKNGGQLFTYFQQDRITDILMLYASHLDAKGNIEYVNEIIKIEDDYRQTSNVKDFYDRWNKIPKNNGVFDAWVQPYSFESKALTPKHLKEIKQNDSSFIFNQFLEILRHNVVSDKPNAFNKIFTLFLCKVYDEKNTKPNEELKFQWLEGKDDEVSFQIRLNDLYKGGMKDFLDKEVADLSENELDTRFASLFAGNETLKNDLKKEIIKLRLEKNNEFAFKEVFDNQTFLENAKIVKEVVELLQGYRIRYNKRQQYLSDFFELLLTTGLKQESGQFFTPVPIAQFIIKSLPIDKMVDEKLNAGEKDNLLPHIIDYAAGSGHFLTESMHEIQRIIDKKNPKDYLEITEKKIKNWQTDNFDWATEYVYGIEKDYRLVKVGKVGCYLHGDGLANVILSDGLANFSKTKEYKGLLRKTDPNFPQENKQFDVVISNPPYSVSSFKNASSEYYGENDFELYDSLTDSSSEIETLFVERTKQLLKDGGVAGIILPSSILNNTGIYTKTREILLKYFEIIAITELGGNTFMATNTNTVVLFLRRRNNYLSTNLQIAVEKFFSDFQDVTLNGIEKPFRKYVQYVWEDCNLADYITLLKKNPNEKIAEQELYQEYRKKLTSKNENEFWQKVFELEKEKLLYFILAYPQRLVIVKSGAKDAEKRFLGYEFSSRRGNEGIHPIQRGKEIYECTHLFDADVFDNPQKASTYIYKAFNGNYELPIDEAMANNVSRADLVDMLTFDRAVLEKNISLAAKKKIKIESKWEVVKLGDVCEMYQPQTITSQQIQKSGDYKVYGANGVIGFYDKFNHEESEIAITCRGATCGTLNFTEPKSWITGNAMITKPKNSKLIKVYLFHILNNLKLQSVTTGTAQPQITKTNLEIFQIPLPPLDIQQKIVDEIGVLEKREEKAKEEIVTLQEKINEVFNSSNANILKKFNEVCELKAGDFVRVGDIYADKETDLFPCYGGNGLRGYVKTFTHDGYYSLVGRQGALCGNVHRVNGKFHATEHALVATPLKEINSDWLYYKLVSMNLNQYATGTAQPGLSVMNLIGIEVNVPTISEQQRIVSEIEKIEEQIAILEKELAKIPAQKEQILKKYL